MTGENRRTNVGVWIFLLIAFSHVFLSNELVDGRKTSNSKKKYYTIEGENGDVIECVDIYKQPAFSHPLLKNHTIQKRPSSSPSGIKKGNKEEFFQVWKKNGECPKGTIPIARTKLLEYPKKVSPIFPNRTHPDVNLGFVAPRNHEYAQASAVGGPYYGAHANLNVWNPATSDGEFSLSQIWVIGGQDQDLNTIEAGWQVLGSDNKTRLFIYWTSDNYQSTGCYNLNCPGFVQTNPKYALGSEIRPVSIYSGQQYSIGLTIHRDQQSRNWWLRVQDEELGYWPGFIFTSLAESSRLINWGGEIVNWELNGRHTSTQMGSGHFPSEGFHKAAMIHNLGIVDNSGALIDPQDLMSYVSKPSCYDFMLGETGKNGFGVHFYFGGPGFSAQCP